MAYAAVVVVGWAVALCLAYLGLIFLLLGGMMGPRGDIDYPGFTAAQKHAANMEALHTQLLGIPLLFAAGLLVIMSMRMGRRFYSRNR
jgi:hypothetical protein